MFETANPGAETLALLGQLPLAFRGGEVVGLFGLAGGEQFDIVSAVGGLAGRHTIRLEGVQTTITSPADAISRGIVLVPADRETEGLVSGQSALESVMLPWYSAPGFRSWWITDSTGLDVYEKARSDFNISGPSHDAEISQFSGGNRQKHLLARWTHPKRPRILLLAQPTQGVDVGAKVDIVRVIRRAAAEGVTVLVASAESDEIASMCDRAYVIVHGKHSELPRSADFDERLLAEAAVARRHTHELVSHNPGSHRAMTSTRLKLFLARNGIFMALIALIALFGVLNPNFLSVTSGVNILMQATELAIIALPLAFLIMSGTIDLSVGSVASLAAVTGGMIMSETGSALLGIAGGLATGAVVGAINGVLISYLGLNSFVVTLGALSVWGGMALLLTGGKTITRTELPEDFRSIGTASVGPIPIQIIILIVLVVLAWYLLNRTQFGKQVLAIGGNRRAARLMGVRVARTQFVLFLGSGFLAAFAGLMLTAKVQSASPTIGTGMELNALTVVLLGGVAFEGGLGRISGVVAGLLFFRVLNNGLIFMQASPFLQTVLVGLTLIVAVALDSTIQRVIRSSWAQLGRKAAQQRRQPPTESVSES